MIRASKLQIEEFKESLLWKDIVDEITSWKEQAAREYDSIVPDAENTNPTSAKVLMHLGHISGRRLAVDYFEGILDTFLSFKEAEDDSERK
jgi:hypothetical protein